MNVRVSNKRLAVSMLLNADTVLSKDELRGLQKRLKSAKTLEQIEQVESDYFRLRVAKATIDEIRKSTL